MRALKSAKSDKNKTSKAGTSDATAGLFEELAKDAKDVHCVDEGAFVTACVHDPCLIKLKQDTQDAFWENFCVEGVLQTFEKEVQRTYKGLQALALMHGDIQSSFESHMMPGLLSLVLHLRNVVVVRLARGAQRHVSHQDRTVPTTIPCVIA